MNPRDQEIWRWRESSADPRALTARAADLADAVRDVEPLPPEALARIQRGVLARRPTRAGRGVPLGLRLALLTGFVLASVATARGTMILWRRYVAAPTAMRKLALARPAARPTARPMARPMAPPIIVEALEEPTEAAPAPLVEASPPPRAHRSTVAAHAVEPMREVPRGAPDERPAAPTPAGSAKEEAQLLARAIARLRQARDPKGALGMLDDYERAYPHGVMQPEALRARLEAVIQMDDRKTALAMLDGRGAAAASAFAGRLGAELLVTRAELRASAGRYADALGDFDRLLAPQGAALPADLVGRALYGRAISLGHLGRDARARADLEAYQRRFPDGKFAGEVARLLKDGGRP